MFHASAKCRRQIRSMCLQLLRTFSVHLKTFWIKYKNIDEVSNFTAEPPRARSAHSGAPWVIKFGKLPIRENLVMTSPSFQDWKYVDERQMERESSKECSVSFLWANESFSLWYCLWKNSTLFLHSGSERLACFEPTKAARSLKTLEVHSVLYDQRKVRF